jgi:RNA polymerase sigma factor (sigma-70 family)
MTTVARVLGRDYAPAVPVTDDGDDLSPAQRLLASYLMHRYASDLLSSDRRLTGYQDQDDLSQDVALSLLAHCPDTLAVILVNPAEWDALDDDPWVRTSVRKYVRAMLRNRKRDAWRKLQRQSSTERRISPLPGWWHGGSAALSRPADVIVMEHMAHERNIAMLRQLPPRLYRAAILRYDGYSYREIGAALGIREQTARSYVQSVRDKGKRRVLGLAS